MDFFFQWELNAATIKYAFILFMRVCLQMHLGLHSVICKRMWSNWFAAQSANRNVCITIGNDSNDVCSAGTIYIVLTKIYWGFNSWTECSAYFLSTNYFLSYMAAGVSVNWCHCFQSLNSICVSLVTCPSVPSVLSPSLVSHFKSWNSCFILGSVSSVFAPPTLTRLSFRLAASSLL